MALRVLKVLEIGNGTTVWDVYFFGVFKSRQHETVVFFIVHKVARVFLRYAISVFEQQQARRRPVL